MFAVAAADTVGRNGTVGESGSRGSRVRTKKSIPQNMIEMILNFR